MAANRHRHFIQKMAYLCEHVMYSIAPPTLGTPFYLENIQKMAYLCEHVMYSIAPPTLGTPFYLDWGGVGRGETIFI
jgi:hypothetical protein